MIKATNKARKALFERCDFILAAQAWHSKLTRCLAHKLSNAKTPKTYIGQVFGDLAMFH